MPFVTRLTRPELLRQADVMERLCEAEWRFVPDSGSGPRRSAADLGLVTLHPGKDTLRPDGTRYPPIELRVVASRFPRTDGKSAGRGVLINDWQVELFAADLDPEAWPAAEVVSAYFGRAGQENRFAQEDREHGLDRIFSYHLPGQELATTIALMVWNQRLARGFELHPPPSNRSAGAPRRENAIDPTPFRAPAEAPPSPQDLPGSASSTGQASEEDALIAMLSELDWKHLLARRPGWSWAPEAGGLQCPAGKPLWLTSVHWMKQCKTSARLLFRGGRPDCIPCQMRSNCLASIDPKQVKILSVTIDAETAGRIDRQRRKAEHDRRLNRSKAAEHPLVRRDLRGRILPDGAAPIRQTAPTGSPAKVQVEHPLFLPAEARRRFRAQFHNASVRV